MEKKSGRFLQPLTKPTNFEKKNQDNNGKLWSKNQSRRESASGSLSNKQEALRKPTLQKFRTADKRPRPRGRPDAVARDETPTLETSGPELGSVFHPGSKKQSLNHLLNFTYTPRNTGGLSSRTGNHTHIRKSKFIKEHFLQANCQFVVNTSGDYTQYLNNPDALVEWNLIEQINVQVNEPPSCPICLDIPAAAKITRCGHIYCWCCILHYLSLTEKTHQKCPICFEWIERGDLRSVTVISHQTFNVGETVTFKLMKRNRNSLTPYPAEEKVEDENDLAYVAEDQAVKPYCKLLLARYSDILSIVERENRELQFQLETCEDSEQPFVQEALIFLKDREQATIDILTNIELGKDKSYNLDDNLREDQSTYIYFYQASDGQHIYIHSINVKMLKQTYGSLEHAPNLITAKVLSKENDSITEEHRRCYKYLAHLPITCSFDTFEIELKPPIVNEETMEVFRDELQRRKKQREKKAKEEKRREKRIDEEANIKLYKRYPQAVLPLESPQQFPSFGEEVTEPLSSPKHCISFAKMAAATPTRWPGLKPVTISDFGTTTKKLKDLSVISGREKINLVNVEEDELSDHESGLQNATVGDAIAQALQKASQSDQSSASSADKGKKKKKSKQKLLLSTSLGYSGN